MLSLPGSSLLFLWVSGFSLLASGSGVWLLTSPAQEGRALALLGGSMGFLMAGFLLQAFFVAMG